MWKQTWDISKSRWTHYFYLSDLKNDKRSHFKEHHTVSFHLFFNAIRWDAGNNLSPEGLWKHDEPVMKNVFSFTSGRVFDFGCESLVEDKESKEAWEARPRGIILVKRTTGRVESQRALFRLRHRLGGVNENISHFCLKFSTCHLLWRL